MKHARGDFAMPARVYVESTEWRAVNSFPVWDEALSNSQIFEWYCLNKLQSCIEINEISVFVERLAIRGNRLTQQQTPCQWVEALVKREEMYHGREIIIAKNIEKNYENHHIMDNGNDERDVFYGKTISNVRWINSRIVIGLSRRDVAVKSYLAKRSFQEPESIARLLDPSAFCGNCKPLALRVKKMYFYAFYDKLMDSSRPADAHM